MKTEHSVTALGRQKLPMRGLDLCHVDEQVHAYDMSRQPNAVELHRVSILSAGVTICVSGDMR
jgi:hypothetical protein